MIELVILVVLIVWASWYLFMGRKITGVDDNVAVGDEGTHSLVVYFSREGVIPDGIDAASSASPNSNQYEAESDTEAAAKMIAQLTGADLFQIRTDRYYRSAFWGTDQPPQRR